MFSPPRRVIFAVLLVVEAGYQPYPHVYFMGQTLANHSYVDITTVGGFSDNVQCITDLNGCCSGQQGPHRGDWYFPEGNQLPFSDADITQKRLSQRVELRRFNNATSPTGIYCCIIPTQAVESRETVYVGLYTSSGGDITISGGVTYNSTRMTLTCISTGGPATTVTWTRDSTTITGGQTVLNNATTATYTHTLTISTAGEYTCNVSNNKTSYAHASLSMMLTSPPSGVSAMFATITSITVSWAATSDATGYTIYYEDNAGGSGSKNVSGGSITTDKLTGLTNGLIYTIFIAARSTNNLPSTRVNADNTVALVPGVPVLSDQARDTTSITINIVKPTTSVVHNYTVMWFSYECNIQGNNIKIAGGLSSYVLRGLEEGISYTINVTANNGAGSTSSGPLTEATDEIAPSGSPAEVTLMSTLSSSITVVWSEVPCIDRNGMIIGYSVRATRVGTVVGSLTPASTTRMANISSLAPSTTYIIEVAAINSAGTGPYRTISVTTSALSPPSGLAAVQKSAISVLLSWTPPSPLGVITGYTISYTGGGTTDSVNIPGGSVNSYTLTGLQNGLTYSISIASTYQNSPGDADTVEVTLIPAPGEVSVKVVFITATSISLSWSVAYGSVSSWEVVWRETDRGTESSSGSLSGTSYTIGLLDSTTIYTVRVSATNVAGTTSSNILFISTAVEVCGSECDAETERVDTCPVSEESCADTPAIIGGVVAIAIVIVVALTMIVIVVLVLRSRSKGNYSTSVSKKRELVDVPSTTSQSLELSKLTEPTYVDPDQFQTSINEAYNVVNRNRIEEDYEVTETIPPPPLPLSSSSTHPVTTDHVEYEAV